MHSHFKKLNLIWAFLLVQSLIFALIAYFVFRPHEQMMTAASAEYLLYLAYILVIASIPGSFKIYKYLSDRTPKQQNETLLLARYRSLVIFRAAVLESATFLAITVYLITGIFSPLYAAFLPLVALALAKPSEREFRKDFFEQDEIIDYETDENLENEYETNERNSD